MVLKIMMVALLCGMTALIAHGAMAVFHDGIRPILPELIEGRMKRKDAGSIAFGLSVGFIASVGISFTLSTGLLNPWLLFLPTDIIGVMSSKKSIAFGFGALWGVLVITSLEFLNKALTMLPVDFIGALGELGTPVLSAFALFPVLAIFYQYGWKKGIGSGILIILIRLLISKYTKIYPESIEIFVGMILLISISIFKDLKSGYKSDDDGEMDSIFEERTKRIFKNLPFLAIVGGLIAGVSNLQYFAGSEVSIYTLANAYELGEGVAQNGLIKQAAIGELMRGLGFIPLIATTALATGVYGVAGFTFVYVVGYLSPNLIIAVILGAFVICLEVILLRTIGKELERFPSIRNSSDHIRNAMNNLMEFSLMIGGVFSVIKMGGYTGFSIMIILYYLNEVVGRPILKIASPAVAAIITGILLNIFHYLGILV